MGGKLRVSADAVAPDERFGFWREIASSRQADRGMGSARRPAVPRRGGRRDEGAVAANPRQQRRVDFAPRSQGDRRPSDGWVIIYRDLSEATLLERNRKTFVMGRGSLIALDFDAPSATHRIDSFKYDLLILPTALLRPHLTKRDRPLGHLFARTPGDESLATTYIESLLKEWDDIQEPAMGAMADALGRLIGVAFGAPVEEHADAVTAGRLAEIDAYIERHFADPALSAASCAAGRGFPSAPSTRLRAARRKLRRKGPAPSVGRMPRRTRRRAPSLGPRHRLRLGFRQLAGSFYRAFQAAFGASPGDLSEGGAREVRSGVAFRGRR